jgi:hypothetical protein
MAQPVIGANASAVDLAANRIATGAPMSVQNARAAHEQKSAFVVENISVRPALGVMARLQVVAGRVLRV